MEVELAVERARFDHLACTLEEVHQAQALHVARRCSERLALTQKRIKGEQLQGAGRRRDNSTLTPLPARRSGTETG